MFLTPTASENQMDLEGFKKRMEKYPNGTTMPNLTTQVNEEIKQQTKMWPTPQAADNRDRGNLGSGAVQKRMAKGKQIMLSQSVSQISGALNPEWVEWLMGFPIGWTDLKHSETQ